MIDTGFSPIIILLRHCCYSS